MRRDLLAIAALAIGCGHAPRSSWVEEDLAPGRSHADGAAAGAGGAGQGSAHVRAPDKAAAEAALARAISAGAPRAIIIAAGDVTAHGGALGGNSDAVAAAIDRATAPELEAAWATLDPALAPAGATALRRALLAHHAGDDDAARAWLARARGAADLAGPLVAIADALGKSLGAPVDRATIAVLVPRTGRFAGLGKELEVAIRIAASGTGVKLVVLDTGGDEPGAVAAVDKAIAAGAVAILGPVGEREAQAAARRASAAGVPIALLAPGDGADPAAGVFRMTTSPADEAALAAGVAAAEGSPTVGIFAPRDDVGDAMAEAFAAAATARGLQVTADGRYDPTGSDLEPDVKQFLGLVPAQNPRLAAHLRRYGQRGWQSFVPDVPFAILYIPDRYDRAALVAAFLPYLGVEVRTTDVADVDALRRKYKGQIPQVVQLIGSSGWNHPALPIRGGAAVEGALIVDVFATSGGSEYVDEAGDGGAGGDATGDGDAALAVAPAGAADFTAAFHTATGRDPTSAAAQAFDATRLVLQARAQAATDTAHGPRAAFALALAHARLDDGACGPSAIGADGEIARRAVVLQVDRGELVPAPY
ncbi:MAG: penicillin-binding protein activator [Deltaproteobacteria bacterium]|nr:penicillin-binding protein activator [Deltaproteobacteria bacterium]